MITQLLLEFFRDLVLFVLSLLKDFPDLPVEVYQSVETFSLYFNKLNSVFPVSSLFVVFSIVLLFELSLMLFKIILLVLKLIRG